MKIKKTNKKQVEGFKVFEPDWTCRGFQYEVGKTFKEDVIPIRCDSGFHFCKELKDCFSYYVFNPENKVARVVALGDVDEEGDNNKCCTNEIQIVEEITWEEVFRIVNLGKGNTGLCNSGDYNSGYYNSGDYNSGDYNSGNRNSGDYNSGYYNSGYYNSGDFNNADFSSGCFNTKEQKMIMFNKPSDWTHRDWLNSDARWLLNEIPKSVVEWICSKNMKDEEKKAHPDHETTDGYLKILDESESECGQIWWNGLSKYDKNIIKSLPNFDVKIFENITGIKVGDLDMNTTKSKEKKQTSNKEIATNIVELFENLLEEKEIIVPCSDEKEQTERFADENQAKLYGMEYWNLIDSIENMLSELGID